MLLIFLIINFSNNKTQLFISCTLKILILFFFSNIKKAFILFEIINKYCNKIEVFLIEIECYIICIYLLLLEASKGNEKLVSPK